jgi:hypothetical protein
MRIYAAVALSCGVLFLLISLAIIEVDWLKPIAIFFFELVLASLLLNFFTSGRIIPRNLFSTTDALDAAISKLAGERKEEFYETRRQLKEITRNLDGNQRDFSAFARRLVDLSTEMGSIRGQISTLSG